MSAEVRNGWSYTSAPLQRLLGADRDSLTYDQHFNTLSYTHVVHERGCAVLSRRLLFP